MHAFNLFTNHFRCVTRTSTRSMAAGWAKREGWEGRGKAETYSLCLARTMPRPRSLPLRHCLLKKFTKNDRHTLAKFSHTHRQTHAQWQSVHYTRHYAGQVDTHFAPYPILPALPFVIAIDTALMSATLVGSVAQLPDSPDCADS